MRAPLRRQGFAPIFIDNGRPVENLLMSNRMHTILRTLTVVLLYHASAMAAPAAGIHAIAGAERTTCAIRNDGALYCWGWNSNGQVGAGRISEKETNPIEVFAHGTTAVAVGYAHVCAVVEGGLSCWGWNQSGQIGTGQAGDAVLTPARIFDRDVSAVAAGGMHTCAVVGGALLCWGDNLYGELGGASGNAGRPTPVRVFDSDVGAVSAQAEDTCAIVHGALWCWGDNRYGQIGNGTSGAQVSQPFKVIDRDVDAVAVGDGYVCAVVAHALQCWGAMRAGNFHSLKADDWVLKPETVIAQDVNAVAAGTAHVCAIVGAALQCWGQSSSLGSSDQSVVAAPRTLVAHGVTAVAAAEDVTCALVDGALRCRGFDSYGAPLTAGAAAHERFEFAGGDVQTLDRTAADTAAARARLPADVAAWLVGKRVSDGRFVYLVTRARGTVDKFFSGHEAWTHMSLDVVGLYALERTQRPGDRPAALDEAAIPAGARCSSDIAAAYRFDDHGPFAVLSDDRFVAVNTATEGLFAKLAPLASGELEGLPRVGAADLNKIDACAHEVLARIARQPLAGIVLHDSEKPITRVPATPDADWTGDIPFDPVSRIEIEPRSGSVADYAAEARVTSSMVCGDLVLADWKHGTSVPWQLARSDKNFEINRAVLDKEDPTFPHHTAAELRAAIAEAKRLWQSDKPIDPSACQEALTGETYTIYAGQQIVQRIEVGYREPKPIVPFDCQGVTASLAQHVAADLGYRISGWDSDGYLVCKVMPDVPGKTLVALAIRQEGSADPNDAVSGTYDLDVSIVDTASRRVFARSVQKGAFTSDAWRFDGVEIDSGRYRLAEGVRAFGVRASSGASSHYSAAADTRLTLYIREGDRLRDVLDGLVVHGQSGEMSAECTGTVTTLERTIDIAPTRSHGFADLIVTSRISETVDSAAGGDCKSLAGETKTTQTTLHYDGTRFVIPARFNDIP